MEERLSIALTRHLSGHINIFISSNILNFLGYVDIIYQQKRRAMTHDSEQSISENHLVTLSKAIFLGLHGRSWPETMIS